MPNNLNAPGYFTLIGDKALRTLSVGFSFQDGTMDAAWSAPQGAHFHADVIYLLP